MEQSTRIAIRQCSWTSSAGDFSHLRSIGYLGLSSQVRPARVPRHPRWLSHCSPSHFSRVTHLSMYFPTNFGDETTRISYIGLRGEYLGVSRLHHRSCSSPLDARSHCSGGEIQSRDRHLRVAAAIERPQSGQFLDRQSANSMSHPSRSTREE